MSHADLKACPFCAAHLVKSDVHSSRSKTVFVHPDIEPECIASSIIISDANPTRVAAWNLRALRRTAMTAEKIAAVDHLDDIAKALTYAAQCLDGVVSMDEEDEGKDGGSATCQSCLKLVNRALGKVEKVRTLLDDYDRLKARVAEMEAALERIRYEATTAEPRQYNDVIAAIRNICTASRPLPTKGDTNE